MRSLIVVLVAATLAQAAPPDTVIHHAKIFTGIAGRPFAEAIAIRGDRIAAVGSNDQIQSTAGASTRSIDAAGRVVIPGFNDAHIHINPQPALAPLPGNGQEPSWAEVRSALVDAIAKTPSGPPLVGIIGGRVLEEPGANREALDAISASRPIELPRVDRPRIHSQLCGLAAVQRREDRPDPPGGSYGRDASGRINGRLHEYAGFRLSLPVDENRQLEVWREVAQQLAAWGITSVQNLTFEGSRDRAYVARHTPELRIGSCR